MRVTFLVMDPQGIAGGDRVIALYAADMRRRGHAVRLIAPAPRQPTLRDRLRWLRRRPSRSPPLPGESHYDALGLTVETLERHRPIEARDLPDADVVVATWWETAEWVARLPAAKGRPIHLVQGHETFPHLPLDRVRAVYRLAMPKIAVSEWLRSILADAYGARDVTVVPNGVDCGVFRPPPPTPRTGFRIGFLHAQLPVKNTGLAIEGVRRAMQARGDLSVLAFGHGAPTSPAVPEDWRFVRRPPQAEIPGLYGACDVWLFTSTAEGFGLPILEAMACGTPVLATRAGAAPELLREGGGRLLDADADVFAAAILEIAAMPATERRRLSEAARSTALRHDWTRSFDAFERTLAALVGEATRETTLGIPEAGAAP